MGPSGKGARADVEKSLPVISRNCLSSPLYGGETSIIDLDMFPSSGKVSKW
jgi:hypothetical protein